MGHNISNTKQIQCEWTDKVNERLVKINRCCGKKKGNCSYHHDLKLIIEIHMIMQFYKATKLLVKNGKQKNHYVMELYCNEVLMAQLHKTRIKHFFTNTGSGIEKFGKFFPYNYHGAFDVILDNLDDASINFYDKDFLKKQNIFGAFDD